MPIYGSRVAMLRGRRAVRRGRCGGFENRGEKDRKMRRKEKKKREKEKRKENNKRGRDMPKTERKPLSL